MQLEKFSVGNFFFATPLGLESTQFAKVQTCWIQSREFSVQRSWGNTCHWCSLQLIPSYMLFQKLFLDNWLSGSQSTKICREAFFPTRANTTENQETHWNSPLATYIKFHHLFLLLSFQCFFLLKLIHELSTTCLFRFVNNIDLLFCLTFGCFVSCKSNVHSNYWMWQTVCCRIGHVNMSPLIVMQTKLIYKCLISMNCPSIVNSCSSQLTADLYLTFLIILMLSIPT